MKVTYTIVQLERLGKKFKQWTIRREETSRTLSISSLVYGPTSLENCINKLATLQSSACKNRRIKD